MTETRQPTGSQVIPRPRSISPGRPAPWAGLPAADLRITLERVREVFAEAPAPRPSELQGTVVRASAVLVALYESEGRVFVILTRRAQHMRSHRGEVSFPGGGQDLGEDLLDTACREAHEEIDLDPSLVEVVGELDHLQTVTSRSFIAPFVAVLPERPELVANPGEVELILHIALDELLAPGVFREELWGIAPIDLAIHFFEVPGDTIWGATGHMLRNLLALLTGTDWR